ncbi:methionine--tRNA ligase subunit beta [bacterium]|nr:methionine--tRNA ligase subunit beta [bacterium]
MTESEGLVSINDFKKAQLRTAKILEAKPHPNADKLMLLSVDVGREAPKQIVAGIRKFYEPADLIGRTIVIVDNLEPALLRGEESQGMLLAATVGDRVVLLKPDAEDVPGGCEVR